MPLFGDDIMDLNIYMAMYKNDVEYIKNSLDKFYKKIYNNIAYISSKEMFDIVFFHKSILNIINMNDDIKISTISSLNKIYNNILLDYMLKKNIPYKKLESFLREDFENNKSDKEKYELLKIMKHYKYIENNSKNYINNIIENFK